MANTIELIKKYSADKLDEKFSAESKTSILETNLNLLNFTGAKSVLVPSITLEGLGDYSRDAGYSKGAVELSWETLTMRKDRSKEFNVDRYDNEETAGTAYGVLQDQFMRMHVVPEIDAYRLSTIFSKAKAENVSSDAITAADVMQTLNGMIKSFEDNEVPLDDAVFFISTEVNKFIKETPELTRQITQIDYRNDRGITFKLPAYEDIPIVVVPKTRFKTAYTFGENGFTPATGAKDINVMLVHKKAALPVLKHTPVKVFNPDENQEKDAWSFQYRVYHDIFTPANKVDGICVSHKE